VKRERDIGKKLYSKRRENQREGRKGKRMVPKRHHLDTDNDGANGCALTP